jgi:uncharacterized lipoprotein YmbA
MKFLFIMIAATLVGCSTPSQLYYQTYVKTGEYQFEKIGKPVAIKLAIGDSIRMMHH